MKADKIDIQKSRNILVPRFDAFGDIVLLQGFIQALLDFLPEARITLLVREGYDQLAPLFPERLIWKTTRVHPYKKPSDPHEIKTLIGKLKEDSYDVLLTTSYNHTTLDDVIAASLTSSWRIRLGDTRNRTGDPDEFLRELEIPVSDDLYDEHISVAEKSHETDKYQTLWKNITGQAEPIPRPKLIVLEEERLKAEKYLTKVDMAGEKFVFCFPAGVANVSLKTWPADNYAVVIAHLEKKYSLKTIIAGHKSEKNIVDQVVESARRHGASPEVWLGKDGDIPFAGALIAKAHFYFGNDTGMMHIASALGKPVVAIFGGGTWPRFLPAVDKGAVLTQELPCINCMWKSCWLTNAPCIKMVSQIHVMEAIDRLLKGVMDKVEVHMGWPLDKDLKALLEKGCNNYKKLSQERNWAEEEVNKTGRNLSELHNIYEQAVNEIKRRDALLTELQDVYGQAVNEIKKRDASLTELGDVYGQAVNEIKKRDASLTELRDVYHQAVNEIKKRDASLTELRDVYHQAVDEIRKRDTLVTELKSVNSELIGANDTLTRINKQAMGILPLVSIVTPVYNGAKWIEQCIQSVLIQDYPKIEHIIVDGGSTDATLDICSKYSHLIVHSQKDRGQSHAINKGFSMAQGDILAWLCGDDEYEPGAIQAAVKGITAGNEVVMGYSRFIDASGNVTGEHPANIYNHFDHGMLLRFWKYGTISQPATFWTRDIWETCGPVRENLFFAMDYDLWLRMSQKTVFHRLSAYVAKYRIHPEAKCFADNYGSRIELINVSKNYWPTKWKLEYWKLACQYLFSYGAITKRYADAERLLNTALTNLDHHQRMQAILDFVSAHFKHFATPMLPGYQTVLKRILGEGIGPLWFWRFAKRAFYRLTQRKKVSLAAVKKVSESGTAIVFNAGSIGYRKPQFKYWAKSGEEFIVLRDWSSESTYVFTDNLNGFSDVGIHVRSGNRGDWQDQAWVKNEW